MEPIEVLKGAKRVLSSRDKWLKGHFAKNMYGIDVDALDMNACRWCLEGSLLKASQSENDVVINTTLMKLTKYLDDALVEKATELDKAPVVYFNDHEDTVYSDVINLIDMAIEGCEV